MLCKSSPTGSLPDSTLDFPEVFNLVSNPTLDLPFSNEGTTASVDFPCNALLATGLACNAPKTERQKFCKKCTTRIRVARLRAKQAPLRELKATVENAYQSERRSAVTGCTTGSTLRRDVGKNTDYLQAQQIESLCLAARVRLRKLAKKRRDALKAAMRLNHQLFLTGAREIRRKNKQLTKTLARAIRASNKRITNAKPMGRKR